MFHRVFLFSFFAASLVICGIANAQIEPDTGQAGSASSTASKPGANKTLALICVAANDFYFGGASGGIYLPEEVLDDELDDWMNQGLNQNRALQDRDGFPAQGLFAYYQLRQAGCRDHHITFMLWHDDEPGNSLCETMIHPADNDDGALVGGGDEWIDYDGDGFNDLDGIDVDGDLVDDLHPQIDFENNDPDAPQKAVTKDNFIAALHTMARRAGPEDQVIVYMVGHGVRTANQPGAPVGYQFEAGEATPDPTDDMITDEEFNDLIMSLFSGGEAPHVTILADFCYSGRFIRPQKAISEFDLASEEPRIAVHGDSVHVVWHDARSTSNWEVYHRKSDDGGVTWGDGMLLSSSTDGEASMHPAVAVDGDSVYVVWDNTSLSNSGEIYTRRSVDGGETFASQRRLTGGDNFQQVYPDVGTEGDYVHVVWHDQRDYGYGSDGEIYYCRSLDNGANWQAQVRLTKAQSASERPRLAVVGPYIHLTWHDTRDNPNPPIGEVYYKRGEDNGATWGDALGHIDDANNKYDRRISDDDDNDSYMADIAAMDSAVYIVWQDDAGLSNGDTPEIHMRRSKDCGVSFDPDLPPIGWPNISWPGQDEAPAVAVRQNDEVHVVWDTVWDVDPWWVTVPGAGTLRDLAWESSRNFGDEMFDNGQMDELLTFHFDNTGGWYWGDPATPDLCVTTPRYHFVWSDKLSAANSEIFFRGAPYNSIWMPAAGDVASKYYMEASTSTHPPNPYGPYAGSFHFYGFWWMVDGNTPLEPCWLFGMMDLHNYPGFGILPTDMIQPTGGHYMDYSGQGLEVVPGDE